MAVAITNPLIPRLAEAIGIDPKRCRSLTLRLCTDDVVTANVDQYVTEGELEKVIQCFTTKEYVLVERLSSAEREALEIAVEYVGSAFQVEHHAKTIQGLLDRMKGQV